MAVSQREAGIITNEVGETVIPLPPGSIRGTVVGESGREFHHVLVEDADLGCPACRLVEGSGIVYNHPYE